MANTDEREYRIKTMLTVKRERERETGKMIHRNTKTKTTKETDGRTREEQSEKPR